MVFLKSPKFAHLPTAKRWRFIYPESIEGHADLPRELRRRKEVELRERVRSRQNAWAQKEAGRRASGNKREKA
jgi:hypothetical protein